jgi:hypothetical protein
MIGIIALVPNLILTFVVNLLVAVERQKINPFDMRWGKWVFVSLAFILPLIISIWAIYTTHNNLWVASYWERKKADKRRKRLRELDRKMLEKSEERRKLEESEESR